MTNKSAMQELIEWMDKNKGHCTYGTIRGEAVKLLEKEKQQIIDAVDASWDIRYPRLYENEKGFIPIGEDYYNKRYPGTCIP